MHNESTTTSPTLVTATESGPQTQTRHNFAEAEQRLVGWCSRRAQPIGTHLTIRCWWCWWTKDGRRVYAVPSRGERGRWHLFVVNGSLLTCDCHAAKYGRYCCHRAAVRARIQEERERDERNMGGAVIDADRGWT
jgi:hypothetical protein